MAKSETAGTKGARKAASKTSPKKIAAKKTTAKKTKGIREGNRYVCEICGLAVTVDTACGCAETAHIVCCETPMKMKG